MAVLQKPVSPTGPMFAPGGSRVGVLSQVVQLGTEDVGGTGTVIVGYLPRGSRVLDVLASVTPVGDGFTFSVGDPGDVGRFINAGLAGGVVRAGNDSVSGGAFAAHDFYAEQTPIVFSAITPAGTAAASGTLRADVLYTMPEPVPGAT